MRNLAGKHSNEKDYAIELELERAGIEPVIAAEPNGREVNARVTGKLGGLTFVRGWYYWCAAGHVPIAMAREMYEDPTGRKDVRVAGHCGCPPPAEWSHTWATASGFVECVDSYHIDTQEGLDLFVRMARKHGIVDSPIKTLGWTIESTDAIAEEMTEERVNGHLGKIIARGDILSDVNKSDQRIIDLVRRCREAHPGVV